MHTYAERLFVDVATGRPLTGIRATVVDAETNAPVQAYRGGAPVTLVSGAHGLVDEFQTEDTTRCVRVTVGYRSLSSWCLELVGASGQAIAELERLTVSHVAYDDDGVPAIVTGSRTARILTDTDGTPVVVPAQEVTV